MGKHSRCVHFPCLPNDLRRENCFLLFSQKSCARSSSFNHIVIISLFITAINIFGFYARRIVAMMQNAKTPRDRPIVKLPREAMRRSVVKLAIAIRIAFARPDPTRLSFKNITPKSLDLQTWFTGGSAIRISLAFGYTKEFVCGFILLAHNASSLMAYYVSSQGVNLHDRFANWSGSRAAQTACGPFVFYHA